MSSHSFVAVMSSHSLQLSSATQFVDPSHRALAELKTERAYSGLLENSLDKVEAEKGEILKELEAETGHSGYVQKRLDDVE